MTHVVRIIYIFSQSRAITPMHAQVIYKMIGESRES